MRGDGMCRRTGRGGQDWRSRYALQLGLDGHWLNILWRGGETRDWMRGALLSDSYKNQLDHEREERQEVALKQQIVFKQKP